MSRYAKVDTRTWGDEKFRALSRPQPNAQSLFLYLLSGPHAQGPGLFEAGEYGLAEKLRWPIEGFRAAMGELIDAGMVRVDWDAHVVLIVNALKHDPPGNGNVLKHWCDLLDTVPECDLKRQYMETLQPYTERFARAGDGTPNNPIGNHSAKGFGNGSAKDSRNPSPNPEPKPEPFPEPKPQPEPSRARAQETPTAPPEKPAEGVRVVGSMREVTDETPICLVAAMCEELNDTLKNHTPDWRSKQCAVAERVLLHGFGEQRVREYVRSLLTWRQGDIDMFTIDRGIESWAGNLKANRAPARASPRSAVVDAPTRLEMTGGRRERSDPTTDPTSPKRIAATGA